MNKKEITIYAVQTAIYANETVLIVDGIKTGFPNPAADYLQESIDMNKVIIQRPENTFVIVAERGMSDEKCIEEGNLLVIEQALTPRENDIVAYTKDGEFFIGKIRKNEQSDLVLLGVLIANIRVYREHFLHNIESLPVLPEEYPGLASFVIGQVVGKIDLNRILLKNSPTTFVTVADGDSMVEDGIEDGNLLIIDKSIAPYDLCLAACYINGGFTLKRVKIGQKCGWLLPSNPAYSPIKLTADDEFLVWGVLVSNIKQFRHRRIKGHGRAS